MMSSLCISNVTGCIWAYYRTGKKKILSSTFGDFYIFIFHRKGKEPVDLLCQKKSCPLRFPPTTFQINFGCPLMLGNLSFQTSTPYILYFLSKENLLHPGVSCLQIESKHDWLSYNRPLEICKKTI